MRLYKMLLAFAGALFIMFGVAYAVSIIQMHGAGYLGGLFRPLFAPTEQLDSALFWVRAVLYIVLLSTSIFQKPLRRFLVFLFLALLLTPLSAAAITLWRLPLLALSFHLLQAVAVLVFLFAAQKNTKELWLFALPLAALELFSLFVVYGLVLLN